MRVVVVALLLLTAAAPAAQAQVVPGEVVVRFEDGAGPALRAHARKAVGGRLDRRFTDPALQVLHVGRTADVEQAAAELAGLRGVRIAEPNYVYRIAATPNDPFYAQGLQWGLSRIEAPRAWDFTTGSTAVRVAVLDTGMDLSHQDLVSNLWVNPNETPGNGVDDDDDGFVDDVNGWDFVSGDAVPADEGSSGHGTHVAGLVAARGNNGLGVTGTAWETSLIPLRVCDAGGACTTANQAAAIVLASRLGARVVNLSIEGSPASAAVSSAIDDSPETLFVAAAGNSAHDVDSAASFPCSIAAANLICVAASNADDSLATSSNFGAASVDLAAPGGVDASNAGILSTFLSSTYLYKQGTSFAAPQVAGVAALLWALTPAASVGLVRNALLTSVDPNPGLSGKVAAGGRLNAFRALATLDNIGPIVTFSAAPVGTVTVPTVEFRFIADDAGATFECRLDALEFSPCSSPFVLTGLSAGDHRFTVRATDALGTVGPETTHEFAYLPPEPTPSPDATATPAGITIDLDGRPPAARRPSALARKTARRFAGLTRRAAASMKPFSVPYRATAGGDVSVGIFAGRVRVGGGQIEILRPSSATVPIAVTDAAALRTAPRLRLRVVAVAKPYIGRAVRVRKLARLAR